MNEAEREKLLDARIQRRLATDAAYRNAENAEEQAAREAEIERQEEAALDTRPTRVRGRDYVTDGEGNPRDVITGQPLDL